MTDFQAPPIITRKYQKTFNRLVELLVEADRDIEQLDMEAVAMLAINTHLAEQAVKEIAKPASRGGGLIIVSGSGARKANPAVALLKEAQLAIRAGLESLGMTPAARKKMQITTSNPNDGEFGAFEEELNNQDA